VTAEVLPSIRKHGAYVMPTAEPEQDNVPMAAHVAANEMRDPVGEPASAGFFCLE